MQQKPAVGQGKGGAHTETESFPQVSHPRRGEAELQSDLRSTRNRE